MQTIVPTMAMPASTPVPISEAKTHLSDLARRVRLQHERITLTRNGEPEAVLALGEDHDVPAQLFEDVRALLGA